MVLDLLVPVRCAKAPALVGAPRDRFPRQAGPPARVWIAVAHLRHLSLRLDALARAVDELTRRASDRRPS